jgi:hypothetical protein
MARTEGDPRNQRNPQTLTEFVNERLDKWFPIPAKPIRNDQSFNKYRRELLERLFPYPRQRVPFQSGVHPAR